MTIEVIGRENYVLSRQQVSAKTLQRKDGFSIQFEKPFRLSAHHLLGRKAKRAYVNNLRVVHEGLVIMTIPERKYYSESDVISLG